jgi:hypothetical protein
MKRFARCTTTFAGLVSALALGFSEGCECASDCVGCEDAFDARRQRDAGVDVGQDAFVEPDTALDAWEFDATGTESCSPGRRRIPVDEDRDGRIDEGCPFYLGALHPVLAAMPVDDDVLGGVRYGAADVTNNATRLFTTPVVDGVSRNEILVFRRGSVREPFAPETQIVLAEAPSAVSATEDGTQLFVEIGNAVHTHVYTWSGGAPSLVATFEAFGDPYVRRDGRELFLSRAGSVYSTLRSETGGWSMPKLVSLGRFPALSEDGLTLYLTQAGELRALHRVSLDAVFEGTSERPEFGRLEGALLVRPVHAVRSRELFFSLQSATGLDVPALGPTRAALFRAEVCRDAPCAPYMMPCTGLRSEDGLHCYEGRATSTYADALTQCAAPAHLVSMHSVVESQQVAMAFPDAWLGTRGRRWESGEPFLFSLAHIAEDTCLVSSGDVWNAAVCTSTHQALCETDWWPSFTD